MPKKAERPKIAAKPKPKAKPEAVVAQPTPAAVVPPSSEVAAAPPGGGVIGGVRGGEVGGRVGGRLGGTGDDVWTLDRVAVRPQLIERVLPDYPPVARARGQEAVVIVKGVIDRSGVIEASGLEVVESKPPFDDAALKAFRKWKFKPGRDESGQSVRVEVTQSIRFNLR